MKDREHVNGKYAEGMGTRTLHERRGNGETSLHIWECKSLLKADKNERRWETRSVSGLQRRWQRTPSILWAASDAKHVRESHRNTSPAFLIYSIIRLAEVTDAAVTVLAFRPRVWWSQPIPIFRKAEIENTIYLQRSPPAPVQAGNGNFTLKDNDKTTRCMFARKVSSKRSWIPAIFLLKRKFYQYLKL